MEKRIFIAILISIGFLWLWAAIAPKLFPELARQPEPAPISREAQTTATQAAPEGSPAVGSPEQPVDSSIEAAVPATPVAAESLDTVQVQRPDYAAVLSNRGAQLVSFRLKEYQQKGSQRLVDLVKARSADRTDYPFALEMQDGALARRLNSALYAVTHNSDRGVDTVEFRYSDGRVSVTKTFRFGPQPFLFDFAVRMDPPMPYRVMIGPGIRTLGAEEQDTQMIITGNGILQRDGDLKVVGRDKANPLQTYPGVEYIGVEDNYFLTMLRPSRGGEGLLRKVAFFNERKERRDDLYAGVNANSSGVVEGDAFFGPKKTTLLDEYGLGEALQFGWFGLIARFLLSSLVWINQFTQNYGFAIVVLTFLIKMVLYPLQHKSIVSMKKMQKVQPKVEAIKARYKKTKTDPEQRQKMNVEMMTLYKNEGINPMAGCLPLILQLPILWGFYNLLSRAIELRGAPFMLWIQDLSEKDPYYITPILMTATMFIQTYITPMTGDPMQRKIFLAMPLVFGFLFKDFPSGLVLYWLVQNVLTIAQQMIMNKWWKEHPKELQNA
ncbi:MAG TPA: membrane protein insertase YidC [Thermoanaerobaculia bacterium]